MQNQVQNQVQNRMKKQITLTAAAALLAIAATNPGANAAPTTVPPLADTLAFTLPSPPSAVYEVAHSMVIGVGTPGGTMEITAEVAMTLDLAFESAEGGVRVTGAPSRFEVSMNNPMMGTQSAGLEVVSGPFDFVLDRRGESEVASFPAVSGVMAQFSPFEAMGHAFFPRLPDEEVEPGGMWTDTVAWSSEDETTEASSTIVLSYTLAGDTVVDGRTLAKIQVAGDVKTDAKQNQMGMEVSQTASGSISGFILWDEERGIMAGSEAEQTLEGTASVPGMPPTEMSVTGTETVRLTG